MTEHTCKFVFEMNVTHIHIKHDEPGKQQATSRIAGKYTCECGKFELLEPKQIEKIPGQKDDAL